MSDVKVDPRGYALAGEEFPCAKCGKPIDLNLLDAKPDPKIVARLLADGVCETEREARDEAWGMGEPILECEECYGPGWLPAAIMAGESI